MGLTQITRFWSYHWYHTQAPSQSSQTRTFDRAFCIGRDVIDGCPSVWRDRSGRELLRRQAYGRRGRGAGGEIPVFGLLKRGGKVQDHPKRVQRDPNVDHRAQDRARQHRLFRQLEGLQRARRVSQLE